MVLQVKKINSIFPLLGLNTILEKNKIVGNPI